MKNSEELSEFIICLVPFSQERFDDADDGVAIRNMRGHNLLVIFKPAEHLDKFPAAVRAFHLAVAELVAKRQNAFFQNSHAFFAVVHAPIVAIGKMKRINVPVGHRIIGFNYSGAKFVSRRNHRSAGFSGAVKGFAVNFLGRRVMNNVAAPNSFVMRPKLKVNPKRCNPDQLFLVIAH